MTSILLALLAACAPATTGRNRSIDSAMVALMFLRAKPSLAAVNTLTLRAPEASARSRPFSFGTSAVKSGRCSSGNAAKTRARTSSASASCGEGGEGVRRRGVRGAGTGGAAPGSAR